MGRDLRDPPWWREARFPPRRQDACPDAQVPLVRRTKHTYGVPVLSQKRHRVVPSRLQWLNWVEHPACAVYAFGGGGLPHCRT